jgi:hypothetical protein
LIFCTAGKLTVALMQAPSGGKTMLWTILGILVLLWLLGFVTHVGGSLIHLLLVVALVVFIVDLLTGRRAV